LLFYALIFFDFVTVLNLVFELRLFSDGFLQGLFWKMFVRKNPCRKGALSVQIMEKVSGKVLRVMRTIGTSSNPETIEILFRKAKDELHSGKVVLIPRSS
jgi:hypothetical protein